AQALGRAAGLPLLDATGERVELRLPDALTGPPASRAELPPGPPPRGVAIDPDPLCGEVLRLAGRLGQRAALWCQDDVLHLAISWCGVPLRRRHVPVAAIERVRADGPAAGVEVLLAGRTIAFARWLPANARRFVAAWLASRLWPELPVRPEPSTAPAAGSLAPAL
ncbi:MAG: hypothetical protein KDE27_08145, partial [Planctomycetes bacterium]|nr:hypothetical protein [Planctomycetota bacterium]